MTNVHNLVKNEYEKRQAHANEVLMSRKEEIYLKFPEIQDIDGEIYSTGIKYTKAILQGGKDADSAYTELIKRVEKLKLRKLELLSQAGFPSSYLETPYKCTACKDTGYISEQGYEKCTCYKQQLIDLMYMHSNLKLTETENFSVFDETCYPDTADEARYFIKKSPRENILGIKEKCLKFIEGFDVSETKNLFFCGPAGVGKTFMANCVAYELMHKGKTVIYQPAPLLFEAINEHKQKSFKDGDYDQSFYKNIFDADLLIIDDLGIETQSAARYSELLNILNTRQSNNMVKSCKTIISTNIGIEELYEHYTERVASRITGFFDVIRFAGEDIRRFKKLQSRQ